MRALAMLLLVTACGPETTSFRTTDRGDGSERDTPPAAAYAIDVAGLEATVHVWSNGGYIGTSNEPMTHIGFEIRNASRKPIAFDSDALQLLALDKYGRVLPPSELMSVTPLGPAQQSIPAGATATLDAYFTMKVRPRVVDRMRVRWSLQLGDARYTEYSSFTRDDDFPVSEPPAGESAQPGS
jgi:hypothetical protein